MSDVAVASATPLSAKFTVDAVADIGSRDITVSTSAGTSSAVSFSVVGPPPTVTAIDTNSGAPGSTITLTVQGSNFVQGLTTVTVSGSGVTVGTIAVQRVRPNAAATSTSLVVTLIIDPLGEPGQRTLTISTTAIGTFTASAGSITAVGRNAAA